MLLKILIRIVLEILKPPGQTAYETNKVIINIDTPQRFSNIYALA